MSFKFDDIQIAQSVILQVKKYQLEKQFKKALNYIKDWKFKAVNFKLRKPKSDWIRYFRINKQYRAWWKIVNNTLFVFDIDDHS